MPVISLDALVAHPNNANRMTPEMFEKLRSHIDRSGDYPPLIVRVHPSHADRFQILDGHHRARALRELGYDAARCEVWEVHDEHDATLLLLTLNRLHGKDDPQVRGMLLAELHQAKDIAELARLLPDSREHIEALLDLTAVPPPADLPAPPDPDRLLQAVTFFFTGPQHRRLVTALAAVDRDRSAALARLLNLGPVPHERDAAGNSQGPATGPGQEVRPF